MTPFHTSFCAVQFLYQETKDDNDKTLKNWTAQLICKGTAMGDAGAFGLSGNYTVMQTTLALPQSMFPTNTAIDGNTTVQPVLVWLDTCNLVPESITSIAMTGKPCVDKYGCVASGGTPPLYTISTGLPGELVPQWRVKSYRMRSIWVLGNYDNNRLPQPSTTSGANLPCNGINFVVTSKP